jgi:hypothetical protein
MIFVMNDSQIRRLSWFVRITLLLCVLLAMVLVWELRRTPQTFTVGVTLPEQLPGFAAGLSQGDALHPLALWPWPLASLDKPHAGIMHWRDESSIDGTALDLMEFDFVANPRLHLELYDQDQDDATPGDNRVDFWEQGVGRAVARLNRQHGTAPIIAAWNGPFFGYDRKSGNRIAFHVAPVVLKGKAFYTNTNHRWTFGVNYRSLRPQFDVLHMPERAQMESAFDWASGSLQCLILQSQPLKLQPFPAPGAPPIKAPVPSTPRDAGHIPDFDHMKSARVSMAWSRDGRYLWLLVVKEADTEGTSIDALRAGRSMGGGWSVADLQTFWMRFAQSHPLWGAVNNDAGDAAQLAYRRPDGNWILLPERMASPAPLLICKPDFPEAPQGGTLMYWVMREAR